MNLGIVNRSTYGVRVDNLHQVGHLRCAEPIRDAGVHIVLDGRRPEAVGVVGVLERFLDVQSIGHDGNDGGHARVDGRREPGRPTAL